MADAAAASAPAAKLPATIADANAVLNEMRFEEMMERVIAPQRKTIGGTFEQASSRMVAQGVAPEEAAAFQKKMMDEVMSAMELGKMKADTAKIYAEVFTEQDLEDMGAFFSTPLGEMMAVEQPAVQERLGAVVQGRMMEVMPRVQQMGREFAAQQKAKREAAGGAAPAVAPVKK